MNRQVTEAEDVREALDIVENPSKYTSAEISYCERVTMPFLLLRESLKAQASEASLAALSRLRDEMRPYLRHLDHCDIGLCETCESHYEHEQNIAVGKCRALPCSCGLDQLTSLLSDTKEKDVSRVDGQK